MGRHNLQSVPDIYLRPYDVVVDNKLYQRIYPPRIPSLLYHYKVFLCQNNCSRLNKEKKILKSVNTWRNVLGEDVIGPPHNLSAAYTEEDSFSWVPHLLLTFSQNNQLQKHLQRM